MLFRFKKTRWLWYILIMVIALLVRGYGFTHNPQYLNPDEASYAYNALLLNERGVDEWNRPWSLVLEAFGDEKIAGYVFATAMGFKIFGYHDWVVRLPSFIAGLLLIPLTIGLVTKWTKSALAGILAGILIVCTPVFFFYSRVGFEAHVSMLFLVLLLLVLRFKATGWNRLVLKLGLIVLLASGSILFYNSPLIQLPLIAGIHWFLQRGRLDKDAWFSSATICLVWVVFLIVLRPLIGQKSHITLFTDPTVWSSFVEYRLSMPELLRPVVANQYVYYFSLVLLNSLAFFKPFFQVNNWGGHAWHALSGAGYFTWPLFFVSIVSVGYLVIKSWQKGKKSDDITDRRGEQIHRLLALFIIGLIPASITVNAPHATRSLLAYWALLVITSYVASFLWKKGGGTVVVLLGLLVVGAFIQFTLHFHRTFEEYSRITWHDNPYEIVNDLEQSYPEKDIFIMDRRGFEYIRFAWYAKIDPDVFLRTIKRDPPDTINFSYVTHMGGWKFIREAREIGSPKAIIIAWDNEKWKETVYE